ncbi:MAG: dihydropteroate synthase, partial [Candidatus Wallbacteria bacterium]|nr:dihydropteroate synthase [Candidatus Wallbacteria bacterium]
FEVEVDNRPVLVGERTNVLGSRKFKRLVAEGQFEAAAEIARAQVKNAAQVIDVCLQDPDRDEAADANAFLERATKMVKVPLMIDSTDAKVLELGLKWSQGKSILNSINLEDGEARFQSVLPLARRYGAALVVGTIDEDPENGMAVTRDRKLEVARRSYTLLTEKYEFPAEDILFDPLVFPCGTGDANYVGSAIHTIEGVRRIKQEFPDAHTILGISNVSFGLPDAGREVLNSVFLYHCTKAGLDFAIVNSEKLERYASIPEHERLAAEDLLFNRREDAVPRFAEVFREKKKKTNTSDEFAGLTLEERIARRIVEGTREGMIADLDRALEKYEPLAVIDGPLMKGMDEVGRLFAANELIVSEVLQSAEAMKASVSHLEQFMKKEAITTKAKIVLATVKGDVHDIGKNLVEIILSNNGFQVVNLGIKVPSEAIVQAYREHKPDAIGLSGLLVKSAIQMVATASDLRADGVDCPVLVGGAALSRKFTYTRIAPQYGAPPVFYARDAMEGLDLMNQLAAPERRPALVARVKLEQQTMQAEVAAATESTATRATAPAPVRATSNISRDVDLPAPPDLERHVVRDFSIREIFAFVNPQMLYGKHLGLRGPFSKLLEAGDSKALELKELIAGLLKSCSREGWMRARAVWQFFPAASEGDELVLFDPAGRTELQRFRFPRQPGGERLCLADFTTPAGSSRRDHVAMFVTTAGVGVRPHVERLKAEGQYLLCHALQALAIESAEGFAELLHMQLREKWGFADPDAMTMTERFQSKYRGVRVSFGYPACPRLEDQEKLFHLLRPEEIGVNLTEGHMMDPEASVSALVFHHPQGRYFSAGEQ